MHFIMHTKVYMHGRRRRRDAYPVPPRRRHAGRNSAYPKPAVQPYCGYTSMHVEKRRGSHLKSHPTWACPCGSTLDTAAHARRQSRLYREGPGERSCCEIGHPPSIACVLLCLHLRAALCASRTEWEDHPCSSEIPPLLGGGLLRELDSVSLLRSNPSNHEMARGIIVSRRHTLLDVDFSSPSKSPTANSKQQTA